MSLRLLGGWPRGHRGRIADPKYVKALEYVYASLDEGSNFLSFQLLFVRRVSSEGGNSVISGVQIADIRSLASLAPIKLYSFNMYSGLGLMIARTVSCSPLWDRASVFTIFGPTW